jgi:hypothetical protein
METPGRRVAVAEAAAGRLLAFCEEQAQAGTARAKADAAKVENARQQLQAALDSCIGSAGGFSIFGGRTRRLLRVFMDHLAAFARQCLAEDLTSAVQQCFVSLGGRLHDRLRDLAFCRQRLRHVQESLQNPMVTFDELAAPGGGAFSPENSASASPPPTAESFWEALQQSATTRVVLPEGEADLERAAARFLHRLTPDQWTQLDQALQDRALAPGGGLHQLCLGSHELARALTAPLLDQAALCLGEHLPVTDVAQVLLEAAEPCPAPGEAVPGEQAQEFFTSAVPMVAGCRDKQPRGQAEREAGRAGQVNARVGGRGRASGVRRRAGPPARLRADPGQRGGQGVWRGGAPGLAAGAAGSRPRAGGALVLPRAGLPPPGRHPARPGPVSPRLRGSRCHPADLAARPAGHRRLDPAGPVSRGSPGLPPLAETTNRMTVPGVATPLSPSRPADSAPW